MRAQQQLVPGPWVRVSAGIDRKALRVARVAPVKSCVQSTIIFTGIADIENAVVALQAGLGALQVG